MQSRKALEGKVAIVTGAGGGIGRAIALSFRQEGAAVIATDIDEAGLARTRSGHESDDELLTLRADVSSPAEVERLVVAAEERYGRLTTLCNNAAVSIPGTVLDTTVEDFDRVYEVNVRGAFLGCKYSVPAMRRAGGGSIINVGSINSVIAERFLVAYCASKGALQMLTRAVALDHAAESIRCNIVCPGYVDTPLNLAHAERFGGAQRVEEMLPTWQPIGRYGRAREVAAVAVFLASDQASFVTGASIMVDGGMTAGVYGTPASAGDTSSPPAADRHE